MKTKKLIVILIAAALAVGLLAGCGGDDSESLYERDRTPDITPPKITTTSPPATTAPPAPVYEHYVVGYKTQKINGDELSIIFNYRENENETIISKITLNSFRVSQNANGSTSFTGSTQFGYDIAVNNGEFEHKFSGDEASTMTAKIVDGRIIGKLTYGGSEEYDFNAAYTVETCGQCKGTGEYMHTKCYECGSLGLIITSTEVASTVSELNPEPEPTQLLSPDEYEIITVEYFEYTLGAVGTIEFDVDMPHYWDEWFENATVSEVHGMPYESFSMSGGEWVYKTDGFLYFDFVVDNQTYTIKVYGGMQFAALVSDSGGYILLPEETLAIN